MKIIRRTPAGRKVTLHVVTAAALTMIVVAVFAVGCGSAEMAVTNPSVAEAEQAVTTTPPAITTASTISLHERIQQEQATTQSTTTTTQPTTTTESTVATDARTSYKWGETANLDGLLITVQEPERVSDGAVAVLVEIENASNESQFYSYQIIDLAGTDGFQYDGESRYQPSLSTSDLQPDLKTQGYVTFFLPSDVGIQEVTWNWDMASRVIHWHG